MKPRGVAMVFYFYVIAAATALTPATDWSGVEQALGRKGVIAGEVYKVTFPRTDLKVKVGAVTVAPGVALTSWAGFEPAGDGTVMMGDLVLLPSEVGGAMKQLMAGGVEITALHNHLLPSSPPVCYLHYMGTGDPAKLARTLQSALKKTGTPLGPAKAAPKPGKTADWTKVENILGRTGKKAGDLLQVSVPRAEKIMANALVYPPAMGVATALNLQRIGNKVAGSGDFVLVASEVNPVVRALMDNGISVTAVHSHMLDESPRLFFVHFWAYDVPERVATGLRAALDKTNSAPAN